MQIGLDKIIKFDISLKMADGYSYLITEWAAFNEIAVHRFLGKSYAM